MSKPSHHVVLTSVVLGLQLACMAQTAACDRDPFGKAPAERGQTIAADFGPTPLMPARSDGGSTSATATSWAAPGTSIELLPLPVEEAPSVVNRDIPRAGFPPGVDRPPKSSS